VENSISTVGLPPSPEKVGGGSGGTGGAEGAVGLYPVFLGGLISIFKSLSRKARSSGAVDECGIARLSGAVDEFQLPRDWGLDFLLACFGPSAVVTGGGAGRFGWRFPNEEEDELLL